jgi:CDGSH-type Zn-finger protein
VSSEINDPYVDRPLAVQLPIGLQQPGSPEVVQALVLAGLAARREGRLVADAGDLLEALLALDAPDVEPDPGRIPTPSARDVPLITPYRDGPYIVRGTVALEDQDGVAIPTRRPTIALCRCGRSQMRPFCDGTHKLTGFRAATGREDAGPTSGS